jgi:alpha-tubulin suppressor-like RCC1 family protein
MSGKSWNGESCLEAPDFSGGAHFFEACHIPGDSPTGDDAKFQQISNGAWHSVFLMRSGKLFSAGLDRYGEAGTGKQTTKTRPFKARYAPSVTSNVDVSLVAMGWRALVVVDRSGSVFTSGVLPMIGCDDRSSVVPSNSPSDGSLANLALANITRNIIATNGNQPFSVASVVANGFAVIIRSQSGHVMSWGLSPGRATNVVRGSIPGLMDSLPTDPQISTIACGMMHCLLWSEANKRMYGFGDSPYGALLQLSTAEIAIELTWFHQNLVAVGIAQLDAGARANIALLTNGSVLFWGRGDYGIARPTTMPPIIYNTTSVSGTIKKVVFSRGDEEGNCILMLTDQGQVWGVGANYWGMLGHLVFSDDWSYSLLQSTALNSWFAVDLYAGEGWNYIITDQGQIVPWRSGEWVRSSEARSSCYV